MTIEKNDYILQDRKLIGTGTEHEPLYSKRQRGYVALEAVGIIFDDCCRMLREANSNVQGMLDKILRLEEQAK